MRCWASPLGGCGNKQSREHYVSKALFADHDYVEVQGLPWCQEPLRTGLGSLTAKILCDVHNNALADLDAAALQAFDAFRDQIRSMEETPPGVVPTAMRSRTVDALALERWFLKTLLNLAYGGSLLIGPEGGEPGVPALETVEIVFGIRAFSKFAGLYVASGAGQMVNSSDTVQFCPLIKDSARILAALYTFRGWRFALCLVPDGFGAGGFAFSRELDDDWRRLSPIRPFDRLDYSPVKNFVAHEVCFDWGGSRPQRPPIAFSHADLVAAVAKAQESTQGAT